MQASGEERSWRTWSTPAQRAILGFVLVDVASYVVAALPGGTSWSGATMSGLWVIVDAFLIRAMLRGSLGAVSFCFIVALLPPVMLLLTQLPVQELGQIDIGNPVFGVGFGLVEAVLLAVALIAGDRDEGQTAGLPARS
jgi:hypothetical protein